MRWSGGAAVFTNHACAKNCSGYRAVETAWMRRLSTKFAVAQRRDKRGALGARWLGRGGAGGHRNQLSGSSCQPRVRCLDEY